MVSRLISTLKGALIGVMILISLLLVDLLSPPTLQVGDIAWVRPHTVTVYNRATIKGLLYLYYEYYPTVTEWGPYPRYSILFPET